MTGNGSVRRTLIRDLKERIGKQVEIAGRLMARRGHGGVTFLDLGDRTGQVQLVLGEGGDAPPVQSIVVCRGEVVAQDRAPGGVEVKRGEVEVLARPDERSDFDPFSLPSPCTGEGPGIEVLLDRRELSLRSPAHSAIARISSEVLRAVAGYLRRLDFVEIKTPKIVLAGAEGGAGMFEVKYFERTAFLAQSPQLYKQAMASTPLERVFEIGPVFRAEKHATGRHLNEFVGIDVEMAFPEGLGEVMDTAAGLLRSAVEHLAEACRHDLKTLGTSLPAVPERIPVLDLESAKEIATGFKPSRANPAEDLAPEDERRICEWAREHHASDAVLVHSYPLRSRPFYTQPSTRRGRSESFDLLLRGLELSSGGLRIHDVSQLEISLELKGIESSTLEPYLRVFRAGCPPHGGFGIGLERLVQKLLDLPNVRYASLFPRDRMRLEP